MDTTTTEAHAAWGVALDELYPPDAHVELMMDLGPLCLDPTGTTIFKVRPECISAAADMLRLLAREMEKQVQHSGKHLKPR